MKIKVPKEITVGSHTYQILLNATDLMDDGLHACANHRRQHIRVHPNRPPSQKASCFLHECLHIINIIYLNDSLSESQVDPLAEGFAQVFKGLDIDFDWSDIPIENE